MLLRERLQGLPMPAPVEALALKAGRVIPLAGRSLDLFEREGRSEEDWRQLVDRLRARLGSEAVYGLSVVPDHRPERAWCPGGGEGGTGPVVLPGRRPLWLLETPRALEAPGDRPRWGGTLALREGPERIEGGWWDGQDVARDYYVAESEAGERLWVYRDCRPPHRWFLHGLFG
jgi:protein ImuB